MDGVNLLAYVPTIFVGIIGLLFLVLYKYTFRLFGVVVIGEDGIGIVNKKFVLFGANKTLPNGVLL